MAQRNNSSPLRSCLPASDRRELLVEAGTLQR